MLRKKILVLSNLYPSIKHPSYGIFVKYFFENLTTKSECIVSGIFIKGKSTSSLEKIWKYIFFLFHSWLKICFVKYDLIYIHYVNHTLLPFLFLSKRVRKKLVLNFHGSDIFPENSAARLIKRLTSHIVKDAVKIVVPSEYYSDIVSSQFEIAKTKIFISPSSGVNAKIFKKRDTYKRDSSGKTIFGFVSRLDVGKGFEVLIEAVEEVIMESHDIYVYVVGDGQLRNGFEENIKEKGFSSIFEFLGGLHQKDIPEVLYKCDCFIFPSYRKGESLGLVGLEAMSCGLPLIGSDLPSISSYLHHGENGYLFEPENAKELSKMMKKFIELDETDRLDMSKNSIQIASRYDSEIVGNDMIQFLNTIHYDID